MTDYIYPPLESNPSDLYDGFKVYMQASIPGWVPYSGELDDWLARAFTFVASQLTEITSDVATSIFRYFGAFIVNLPPIAAQPAQTLTTWTMQDTAGYTVDAYTQFTLTDALGNQQGFETTTTFTVPNGNSTATGIPVFAIEPGIAGNDCTGSAQNITLAFVSSIATATPTAQGSDDEDDATYLSRLAANFRTLSPKPITATDFSTIVLDQPLVGRVTTLPGFNPANATQTGTLHTNKVVDGLTDTSLIPKGCSVTGTDIAGGTFVTGITSGTAITISANATGSTTTTLSFGGSLNNGGDVGSIVGGVDGMGLSSPEMAAIQDVIQAQLLAGVNYTVGAPTSTTINIVASVFAWSGQSTTDVQTAVKAALASALTPLQWGLQATSGSSAGQWLNDNVIRLSQVEFIIMQVPGVHYVTTLTINSSAADLPLAGIVPIPSPGTMTITVATG